MKMAEVELGIIERSARSVLEWRTDLISSIRKYRDWLESGQSLSLELSLKFQELEQSLAANKLSVAFVGEFSRGKSELINALFFRGSGGAKLPSGLGRTTMSPTEIFFDPDLPPTLWLLPFSTRSSAESIRDAKARLIDWTKVNLSASQSLEPHLNLLSKTDYMPRLEAQYLGLIPPPSYIDEQSYLNASVEVPAWRYAMINLPNPLLRSGIRIIDTPGLNAVGCEPELTLSLLPSAHAVIFLLDADTGVTKTDLEAWEKLIPSSAACRLVVINKIDLVESALKSPTQVELELNTLKKSTSQLLGVGEEHIFMISAKWAVEATALGDAALFRKSGVEALENFFASNLLPSQQQLLARSISSSLLRMVEANKSQLQSKLGDLGRLGADLLNMKRVGREASMEVWKRLAADRDGCQLHQSSLRAKKAEAKAIHQRVLLSLADHGLDQVCDRASARMESAWTTRGLVSSMTQLMRDVMDCFRSTDSDIEKLEKLVYCTYQEFSSSFGYRTPGVPRLCLSQWEEDLRRLEAAAHAFATNPTNIVLLEKSFMIKKFWSLVVSRSREIYVAARAETERWLASAFLPIEIQLNGRKKQLAKTTEIMEKLREKNATLDGEILRQSRDVAIIQKELRALDDLIVLMSPKH